MDTNQQNAITKCMPKLTDELDSGAVSIYLRARGILTSDDIELVQAQTTSKESRMKLMDLLKRRDNAWDGLIAALRDTRQNYLGK